jgi:5'-AMP-activated protein kinase regulatory gamma subunit
MTPAPGTDRLKLAPPAAKAGVGVVAGLDSTTPRGRAASTSSGPSTTVAGHGHVPQFVPPSSYLRCRTSIRSPIAPTEPKPLSPLDRDQLQGLHVIRDFLKVHTSYDVLPLSFRLIILDTGLPIKKAINILTQNSIVSAPLWDSKTSRFAGILTSTDFINVIQYYCQFPDEINKLDQFRLSSLRGLPVSLCGACIANNGQASRKRSAQFPSRRSRFTLHSRFMRPADACSRLALDKSHSSMSIARLTRR